MADQSIAETVAYALTLALVEKGVLDADDLTTAAERLDGQGEIEAAHVLRCALVEAAAPSDADWQADQRRARFHVIANPDGGNSAA